MKTTTLLLLLVGLALAHPHETDDHPGEHSAIHQTTVQSLNASPTDSIVTVTFDGMTYTIPVFDPSNALTFGATATDDYPGDHSAIHSAIHSPRTTTTASSTAAEAASSGTDVTDSSAAAASTTTAPSGTSSTASALQQSTGVAHANYPEIVGAIAGGLVAGFALA